MSCKGTEHVGLAEIAERLDVRQKTLAMWNYRGSPKLPDPCGCKVSKMDAWLWADVKAWAKETGRLPASG